MEGALLGAFMISACVFGTLLEHPDSQARRTIQSGFGRRVLMGLAMGVTAVLLIYSPWGQRSGAHMNPAVTLTFLSLGKVAAWDAIFYIVAQFTGGAAGVAICRIVLGHWLTHASVDHVVTVPGPRGRAVAWMAELVIALVMMWTVLYVSNHAALMRYTAYFAGALLTLYIAFEAPLSGMSLNPARTLGSAVVARRWRALWVYLTAPVAGMLLGSVVYASGVMGDPHVYCAKLDHCNGKRCIFRCEFERLGNEQMPPSTLSRGPG